MQAITLKKSIHSIRQVRTQELVCDCMTDRKSPRVQRPTPSLTQSTTLHLVFLLWLDFVPSLNFSSSLSSPFVLVIYHEILLFTVLC